MRTNLRVLMILCVLAGCRHTSHHQPTVDSCGSCHVVAPYVPPVEMPPVEPAPPAPLPPAVEEVAVEPAVPEVPAVVWDLTEEPVVEPYCEVKAAPVIEVQQVSVPTPGHGDNFEWVIGNLQKMHTPDREWQLRFAPIDELAPYGGSLVLVNDSRMDPFQDGDLVRVEGRILRERASMYASGPLYRVLKIELLSRESVQHLDRVASK